MAVPWQFLRCSYIAYADRWKKISASLQRSTQHQLTAEVLDALLREELLPWEGDK